MNLLEVFTLAMMCSLLVYGLCLAANWESDKRILGIATLAGVGLATYLFFGHWLFVKENNPYGLIAIALLTPTGYLAGLALRSLVRIDWFEDLLEVKPLEAIRPKRTSTQGRS